MSSFFLSPSLASRLAKLLKIPGNEKKLLIEDAMRVPYTVGLVVLLLIPDSIMRRRPAFLHFRHGCLGCLVFASVTRSAWAGASLPLPTPSQLTTMQRPASELIGKQEPPKITPRVLEQITPDTASILISLSKQRAYLLLDGEIAVDTPISSGKKSRMTPQGRFSVLEKDKDHRSSVYGAFVDRQGRIVRGGVSTRIDSAPSGTHYAGAPMLFFLRLTENGVGMHVGILPGYPASHGCVRLPAEIAPIFYEKTKVGTPAEIVD